MQIEMLNGYVVDIKVKKVEQKRFSKLETMKFLNILRLLLNSASVCFKIKNDTYFDRIACGISKAIYTELNNAGYWLI